MLESGRTFTRWKIWEIIYNDEQAVEEIIKYIEGSEVFNKEEAREFLSTFTIKKQIEEIEKIFK